MADIQTTVKTALAGIGVPVFLGTWQGTTAAPAQYIRYTSAASSDNCMRHGSNRRHEYTVYVERKSGQRHLTSA